MKDSLTNEDLEKFGRDLLAALQKIICDSPASQNDEIPIGWVKGKRVRKILDISPGSLQNLRVSGKLRFRKLMGSYYYHRQDLEKLFDEEA